MPNFDQYPAWQAVFSLGYGTGSGSYHHDVSPWVIGYILGVEWEPTTVAFPNQRYPDMAYHGEYFEHNA